MAIAVVAASVSVYAQGPLSPTVEALYADASAKESAVRKALVAPKPPTTVLRAVRTVILDYEAIVRRYPSSAYCDDALWRAALISGDAFRTFGDAREQASAIRLLRFLQSQYPSSSLVKRVPALVAELSVLPVKTAPLVEPLPSGTVAGLAAPPVFEPDQPVLTAPTPALAPSPSSMPTATSTPTPTAQPTTRTAKPASAAAPTSLAILKGIRRSTTADVVRIIIEFDREVSFHDQRLDNPSRVFLDLPATEAAKEFRGQTIRFDGDNDLVRQVRLGSHPNNMTRVVLETAAVSSYSVYPLYNPFRLVIDCLRDTAGATTPAAPLVRAPQPQPQPQPQRALTTRRIEPWARVMPRSTERGREAIRAAMVESPLAVYPSARPPQPAALIARRVDPWTLLLPESPTGGAALIGEALVEPPPPEPPAPLPITALVVATLPSAPVPLPPMLLSTPTPPLGAPSRTLAGGFSLARQLGLGVSRIVIDPGHGGHDPGAKGAGTSEAQLVLDVALRLEALLKDSPGMEVVLTRRTDQYVALDERTAIANREGADLFLSIHANANSVQTARGVETYFLNFATSLSAAAVAARENAASGQTMGDLPDRIKTIALNNKLDESRDFATYVQRELIARLRPANQTLRDLGVKQAPFQVLIGAAMPSVLVEIAFVTNSEEARLLKQSAYRQKIAESLFQAVRRYQGSLKKVPTIAQQP